MLLQTESAERGTALVAKQMENIAVNSRSYLDLVKLVPGVVSTVNLQTAGPGGLGSISANGTRTNSACGSEPFETSAGSVNITVSLGVSSYSGCTEGPVVAEIAGCIDGLIKRADAALYSSKTAGRNRVTVSV